MRGGQGTREQGTRGILAHRPITSAALCGEPVKLC
jgi:hypothetical protein